MTPQVELREGCAGRRLGQVAMLVFAAILLFEGWRGMSLEDHFLGGNRHAREMRSEIPSSKMALPLHYFRWRSPVASNWGELSKTPGLGLEEELVVESYKCSKKDGRQIVFSDVQNRQIASDESVIIVLKRGACPKEE